jgi:hypothetical protein
MPLNIPGTSIRPPDMDKGKKCPNCRRYYKQGILRVEPNTGKKTTHCPFCNFNLSVSETKEN